MFWHGRQMYRRLSEEVGAAGLASAGVDTQPVTEDDLAGLPATVQGYLRAVRARVSRSHGHERRTRCSHCMASPRPRSNHCQTATGGARPVTDRGLHPGRRLTG
jgi:hypothetical protein